MCRFATLASVAIVLFVTSAASAEDLFSVSFGLGGIQPGRTDTISFPINYGIGPNPPENPTLFEDVHFTLSDVGKTVTLTRDTDGDFDAFTALLTDGVKQQVTFWFYPAPAVNRTGYPVSEPSFVWGDNNDPRIDLHGGPEIAAYTLRLDRFTVTNRASDSTFDAAMTFSAVAVPEPAAAGIACASAAGLLLKRRRRPA